MGYSTTALATLVVIENELLKAELRQLRIRNLAAEERLIADRDAPAIMRVFFTEALESTHRYVELLSRWCV